MAKKRLFSLGVAFWLHRPLVVLERVDGKRNASFFDPVKVYGLHLAPSFFRCCGAVAEVDASVKVPTYVTVPLSRLMAALQADPLACSVMEYGRAAKHFDPWVLAPASRAVAAAAAATATEAAAAAVTAAAEAVAVEQSAKEAEEEAASDEASKSEEAHAAAAAKQVTQ